ncbi:cupin domain-containing protein [Caulobacter sp. AP07]|uniref:cupin domain-containing protein n=1 Tax=Caulobacter sp. AP07 TaxID=1144304 RepID=UPI0002720C73|nr:cupin domain-containing protein [Caulobacter sp. AP07]EJL27360.1 cupin domain-containing protein [Caulobacter sp. AP07]
MDRTARRVVTGHNQDGRAVIVSDGAPPVHLSDEASKTAFFEIWNTNASPAPVAATEAEPTARPVKISPRHNGSIIRLVDFHPGGPGKNRGGDQADLQQSFAKYGDATASTWRSDSPHPGMHRTESIDYGIVLEGEIHLVLDADETRLTAGDIVVQRGTNHAWDNRSDKVCRMAFILVDGAFDGQLANWFRPTQPSANATA